MYDVTSVPGARPTTVPCRKSFAETRHAPNANEHAANGNIGDNLESITIPAAPLVSLTAWSRDVNRGLPLILRRAHARMGPNRAATKQMVAPIVAPTRLTSDPSHTPYTAPAPTLRGVVVRSMGVATAVSAASTEQPSCVLTSRRSHRISSSVCFA
jgi:hypothetical protein